MTKTRTDVITHVTMPDASRVELTEYTTPPGKMPSYGPGDPG